MRPALKSSFYPRFRKIRLQSLQKRLPGEPLKPVSAEKTGAKPLSILNPVPIWAIEESSRKKGALYIKEALKRLKRELAIQVMDDGVH